MAAVLLTSAGGLTGTYLIRHLQKSAAHKIVGVDSNKNVPARRFADEFYIVPRVNEPGYLQRIKQIIEKENCSMILPVSSHDVEYYSRNKNQFNSKLLLLDYDLNTRLSNKESCYQYLESMGISVPRMYKREEAEFPCVIKPKCSSGSRNTQILRDETDLAYYSKRIDHYILTEFLEGDEYTVDCLFGWDGKSLGYNVRKRLKTVSGGAVVCQNCLEEDMDAIIGPLEQTGKIVGPVNFQYKRKGRKPVVFDFNTRLPSGGLPLTVQSGFDIPNLMLDLLQGKRVEKWCRCASADGLTMIRYYEEVYLDT